MARDKATAGGQAKGKHKHNKRQTNARSIQSDQERRTRVLFEEILTASRKIEEWLVHDCCSTNEWSLNQNRDLCMQLVQACTSLNVSLLRLAIEFQESFREIAEKLPAFPCLFPAHVDHQRFVQKFMFNNLNLGKRYPLKVRGAPSRKTFSLQTWANKLLTDLIHFVDLDEVPLTRENAKQWLDAIWEVLLLANPNPETHPRLRQLVERPSLRTKRTRRDGTVGEKTQAHNIRASIKAKLGVYLKRMLNDSAVHK
jgi:hypothetical protein